MIKSRSFITFSILALVSILCACTTTSRVVAPQFASSFLALPFSLAIAFDEPGPYGNWWWRKEPLKGEEAAFKKALNGPASPEVAENGDYVGWYGVLVGCKQVSKSQAQLTLDHRFADDLNIYFGARDSRSIIPSACLELVCL